MVRPFAAPLPRPSKGAHLSSYRTPPGLIDSSQRHLVWMKGVQQAQVRDWTLSHPGRPARHTMTARKTHYKPAYQDSAILCRPSAKTQQRRPSHQLQDPTRAHRQLSETPGLDEESPAGTGAQLDSVSSWPTCSPRCASWLSKIEEKEVYGQTKLDCRIYIYLCIIIIANITFASLFSWRRDEDMNPSPLECGCSREEGFTASDATSPLTPHHHN
jgi:hypothetical protein